MWLQVAIGFPHHILTVKARFKNEDCMDSIPGDDRRLTNACDPVERGFNILRKNFEAFGSDNDILLASSDHEIAFGTQLTDVACAEPAIVKCGCSFGRTLEVARGHIVPAHHDLAILSDLDVNSCERLARRALLSMKGVAETDDRRRLGKSI